MQTQNLCKKALENLILPDFEGDPYDDNTAWEYARLVPSSSSNMVLRFAVIIFFSFLMKKIFIFDIYYIILVICVTSFETFHFK